MMTAYADACDRADDGTVGITLGLENAELEEEIQQREEAERGGQSNTKEVRSHGRELREELCETTVGRALWLGSVHRRSGLGIEK